MYFLLMHAKMNNSCYWNSKKFDFQITASWWNRRKLTATIILIVYVWFLVIFESFVMNNDPYLLSGCVEVCSSDKYKIYQYW